MSAQTLSCKERSPSAERLTASRTVAATGSGFDLGTTATEFKGDACQSNLPFFVSLPAADGNYRVRVALGGPEPTVVTVRAEARRLFVKEVRIAANESHTEEFIVNVRTPLIDGHAPDSDSKPAISVKLKPREVGSLDWDSKITLEFGGVRPAVRSITVTPVPNIPTLYLAGDSTVVDQDKEPYAAWGQMMPVFFGPKIAIANEAESGETIRSFVVERRFAKILSTIRSGDYLMVQFAHNDQKPGEGFVSISDYKATLLNYVLQARAHGATPIIVTSMNRRSFDANAHITPTLGEYPQAARDVATAQHVELVDLNAASKTLFEAMGPQETLHAFVHFPANSFPQQTVALADDTHFTNFGAFELARCIVQILFNEHSPLASYLRLKTPSFDPAHPEISAEFHLPMSATLDAAKPYER